MIFKLGFVGKHNLDIKQQAERILKSKRSIGNRRLRRKIRILRKHRDLEKYRKIVKRQHRELLDSLHTLSLSC